MLKDNEMKKFILYLYIATAVALPSGVYILDEISDQFYNPITQPHSQLNISVKFRGDGYRAAQKLVVKTKTCIACDVRSWCVQ